MTKTCLALVLFFVASQSLAIPHWQNVDVGFAGSTYFIHTPLKSHSSRIEIGFELCSDQGCVPISQCWYLETSLRKHLGEIADLSVRSEALNLLNSSFVSLYSLEQFYPALTTILKSARSDCSVKSLEDILLVH